jgi:hypothetical protein
MEPILLESSEAASWCFDLNASEDCIGLAHVIFCDGFSGPTDDVGGAFGETKLHRSTSPGIRELADLIPK